MIGWFDLLHFTLVGLGVIFAAALTYAGFQKVVALIVLVHSKTETQVINRTVSEEHEVHHHVHHLNYSDEPTHHVKRARTVRTPPVEYQQVSQVVEPQRVITRVKRT